MDIPQTAEAQFAIYERLLLEWNEKMNLTAITDHEEIWAKHFADSLTVLPELAGAETLIDIGTGAGFPGIPVAIMRPDIQITLLDSLQKRVNFLECVKAELGLKNVRCVHARAEEAGRTDGFRECFDVAVSRAVARLSALAEYCLPVIKVGGKFISMKGPDVKEEVLEAEPAIRQLGGEILERKQVQIPYRDTDTELAHTLVIVRKVRHTPQKFPRAAVKIAKSPIV